MLLYLYSVLTGLNKGAFSECRNLTSVIIPESVTAIGDSAFLNCQNLISVVIPESVTAIGDSAFINCLNLTSVVIPESVTEIGHYAFYNCTNLTSVEFKSPEGWKRGNIAILADDLRNSETAAKYLTSNFYSYTWTRENKGE